MKKISKQIVILLTILIACCFIRGTVYAGEDNIVDQGEFSETLAWKLDSNGVLTIDGDGCIPTYFWSDYYQIIFEIIIKGQKIEISDMKHFSYLLKKIRIESEKVTIHENAFSKMDELTEVYIESQLETISADCFKNCDKLEEVTLPSGLLKIEESAFSGCKNLKSVNFSEGLLEIGESAFSECERLELVNLPNSVKKIGKSAFQDCKKLKSINLPTSLSKIDDYVFAYCTKLSISSIPKNIKSIGNYSFYACKNIKSISIPSNVKSIDECAFSKCSNLKKLEINGGKATLGYCAFKNCSKINEIKIDVKKIGVKAFANCKKIQKIKFTNILKEIGMEAFANCSELKEIKHDGLMNSIGDYAFLDCKNLKSVKIGAKTIRPFAFGHSKKIEKIILNKGTKYLEANCFEGCAIKEITLPEGVRELEMYAFESCKKLSIIRLPKSLKELGVGAFGECSKSVKVYYAGSESMWKKVKKEELKKGEHSDKDYRFFSSLIVEPKNMHYNVPIPSSKISISKCVIKLSKQKYAYDGNEKKPSVYVKYKGEKLIQGTDYSISYKNNIKVGKATVIIKGKGKYSGIVKKSFIIK